MKNLPIILVVEDDPLIQGIVEEALSEGGFEVFIASSGDQALELLLSSEKKPYALVTDINLGRDTMSGWDVARQTRESNPDFPVVYMSRDSAGEWSSKGVPHSIMLAKPFALATPSPLFHSSSTSARQQADGCHNAWPFCTGRRNRWQDCRPRNSESQPSVSSAER